MLQQYKVMGGDKLIRIHREQIGDGGKSRLDIILDRKNRSIYTYEYDDYDYRKCQRTLEDQYIIGVATNDYDSRFPVEWQVKFILPDFSEHTFSGIDKRVDITEIENFINKHYN